MTAVFRWLAIVLFALLAVFLILFGALYSNVPGMLPFHAAAVPPEIQYEVLALYLALMNLIGVASAGLGILALWTTLWPLRRRVAGAALALTAGFTTAFLGAAVTAEQLAAAAGTPTSWHIMGILIAINGVALIAHWTGSRVRA